MDRLIVKAEKIIVETDQHGRLLHQPDLPSNTRMEVIFLMPDNERGPGERKKRKPSPLIMGKGKIIGDIMSPVCLMINAS
jgi:hypothetical protein